MKGISVKKNIFLIILAFIVLLGVLVVKPIDISTGFSLRYDGVDQGKDANGGMLTPEALHNEKILKVVLEKAGMAYSPAYLKAIQVQPVVPSGMVKATQEKQGRGEDYSYSPSEYRVVVKVNNLTGPNYYDAFKIANAYVAGYKAYFVDTYCSPHQKIGELIKQSDLSMYDYPDAMIIANNDYDLMIQFLEALAQKEPKYLSEKGTSFKDLKALVLMNKQVNFNKNAAIIDQRQLTKDKTKLIDKYKFLIQRYEASKNRALAEAQSNQEILTVLKAKGNTLLVSSGNSESMTLKALDSSYDEVAARIQSSKATAANYQSEIDYYNRELLQLTAPTLVPIVAGSTAEGDELITLIEQDLEKNLTLMIRLSEEYYLSKYEKAVTQTSSPLFSILSKHTLLNIAIQYVAILFVFIVLKNMKQFFSGGRRKREKKPA